MKLSKRLQAIADLIIKYKQGEILADIGTDHAYLPCALVQEHIIKYAYACDIASGPIQASKETIQTYHLENNVIPLLGSGMNPIIDKKTDMISICGMGGKLMVDILEENKDYFNNHLFFLQPNVGIDVLREYLMNNKFVIIDEDIVKDVNHIYEVIVAIQQDTYSYYNEKDLLFGPCLRKKKVPLFYEKWQKQLTIQKNILSSLDIHHPKYEEVKHMITLIEGEINESESNH